MADDFKVRFPNTYSVHSSTSKRDHVTENAVNSADERRRERRRQGKGDSMEFSVDGVEEDAQQADQRPQEPDSASREEGPAHAEDRPSTQDISGNDAPPHDEAESNDDTGLGGILDVEA